jgi:alginate O-acetyltransferase complex protein AlgJ
MAHVTSAGRRRTIWDHALIAAFCSVTALPLAGWIVGFRNPARDPLLHENRPLAPAPRLDLGRLKELPREIEAYFCDHFAFRGTLIRWHTLLLIRVLRTSPSPSVLLGKPPWLYVTGEHAIANVMGAVPFSETELARWAIALELRRAWLEGAGVPFLFVVAPGKTSIYPEYLPRYVRIREGRSRTDQWLDYMRRHTQVEILDLRDPVRQGKAAGLVFYENNTHWSDRGALLGYQAIVKRLSTMSESLADLRPMELSDFRVVTGPHVGDLVFMLGLTLDMSINVEYLRPRAAYRAHEVPISLPAGYPWPRWVGRNAPMAKERADRSGRILALHDSFLDELPRTALAEHFGRSVFLHEHTSRSLLKLMVEQEHPTVIVEEYAERVLERLPTEVDPLPPASGGRLSEGRPIR